MSLPVNPSLSGVQPAPSYACSCSNKPSVTLSVYSKNQNQTYTIQPGGQFIVYPGDVVYISAAFSIGLSSSFGCSSIGQGFGFTPYTYIYIPGLGIGIQDTSTSLSPLQLTTRSYPSSYPPGFSYTFSGSSGLFGAFDTTDIIAIAQFELDTTKLSSNVWGHNYTIEVGICGYSPVSFTMVTAPLSQSASPVSLPSIASCPFGSIATSSTLCTGGGGQCISTLPNGSCCCVYPPSTSSPTPSSTSSQSASPTPTQPNCPYQVMSWQDCQNTGYGICVNWYSNGTCCCQPFPSQSHPSPSPSVSPPQSQPSPSTQSTPSATPTSTPSPIACGDGTVFMPIGSCYEIGGTCVATQGTNCCCQLPPSPTPVVTQSTQPPPSTTATPPPLPQSALVQLLTNKTFIIGVGGIAGAAIIAYILTRRGGNK